MTVERIIDKVVKELKFQLIIQYGLIDGAYYGK